MCFFLNLFAGYFSVLIVTVLFLFCFTSFIKLVVCRPRTSTMYEKKKKKKNILKESDSMCSCVFCDNIVRLKA